MSKASEFDTSPYQEGYFDTAELPDDVTVVKSPDVVDTGRWHILNEAVVKFSDESFARIRWAEPATEMQECDPNLESVEVFPRDVTTTVYEVAP